MTSCIEVRARDVTILDYAPDLKRPNSSGRHRRLVVPSLTTVSVVIPTLDRRDLLDRALRSVWSQQSSHAFRVIVVDNGSSDGTSEWLAAKHPCARLIRNHVNRGFAAAINQAIECTESEWIACLNNDAVALPGWLQKLCEVGESSPHIGAVASRMMFASAPGRISSTGVSVDASGGAWDLGVGRTSWPTRPTEVFGASAGACLYRRSMLEDVGLMDANFFAYLEDVDLAWRARLRGWRAILAPEAEVHHEVSATAVEGSPLKRYLLARNKWRVILRNWPGPLLTRCLPTILTYDMLALAHSLAIGDSASLRGRRAAVSERRRLLRERRAIQLRSRIHWRDIAHLMSPLASPWTLYLRGKMVARLSVGAR
jgi:GT2 family glycosyltransferase